MFSQNVHHKVFTEIFQINVNPNTMPQQLNVKLNLQTVSCDEWIQLLLLLLLLYLSYITSFHVISLEIIANCFSCRQCPLQDSYLTNDLPIKLSEEVLDQPKEAC